MIERHKMRLKKQTPVSNLFAERFQYNELRFSKRFSQEYVESTLDLLFSEMQPKVIVTEDKQGTWLVHSGSGFIQSIVEYMQNKYPYPTSGVLDGLQGKRFSEIPKMEQRKIQYFEVHISLYEQEGHIENDTEFVRLVTLAEKLS